MSTGSWQAFADSLSEENRALGELGAAALAMTTVLVLGTAHDLDAAEREVEAKRVVHAQAHLRRTLMMQRGFGDRTLQQVCSYAPRPLRPAVSQALHELRTRGIALRITVSNNKTLINAGLARIANTLAVMQQTLTEHAGTYHRRGVSTRSDGSLIVSRRA